MNGFGVHTFKLIKDGAAKYVKFHWITDQGEANLTDDEAITVGGTNQAHATTDLFESIKAGEFPSWTFKVQIMDIEDEVRASLFSAPVVCLLQTSTCTLFTVLRVC